jgi:hypothetical protein
MEARYHTQGARYAQAKMAEVEAGLTPFTETQGSFTDDPNWTWTMTAEPQGAPNLYLVTLTVCRNLKGRNFELTVSQMMLDPAAVGSAAEATRPTAETTTTPETTTPPPSGGMSP